MICIYDLRGRVQARYSNLPNFLCLKGEISLSNFIKYQYINGNNYIHLFIPYVRNFSVPFSLLGLLAGARSM